MPGLAAFAKASAGQHRKASAKPLRRPWRSRAPGIHQSSENAFISMDCRVKPGNDDLNGRTKHAT
jgi:hypothetical protein